MNRGSVEILFFFELKRIVRKFLYENIFVSFLNFREENVYPRRIPV